ncbi:MAG: glyoxalase superfamily protein [Cycloclasticus sp.]
MFDEEKAKEFYVDYLGFNIDWEYTFHSLKTIPSTK